MIAVGVVNVPIFARLLRGTILGQRESDYVLAARAIGVPRRTILDSHILPNSISPVIVAGDARDGDGDHRRRGARLPRLGPQDPATPEWGTMLTDADRYLQTAPFLAIFPGLAIVIVVLGFNLIGDGCARRSTRSCAAVSERAAARSTICASSSGPSRGTMYAVNGISFDDREGETLGIVGESGCGKSVTALALLGILPRAGRRRRRAAQFEGRDLLRCRMRELRTCPGQGDRDDLPGPDDEPEPGAHDRAADPRGARRRTST